MFSMSLSFVSAAGMIETVQGGVRDGYTAVEPALEFVVGETAEAPELFLAKILLAIIIFSIVWIALSKVSFFSENEWSLWLLTIAVSLLAIRWIGDASVVNAIILPYSALGVALTAGLPFVLAFLIIENNFNKTMRKIAWVFFIVIFVALWIMRSGDNAGAAGAIGGPIGSFVWIYLATGVLALVVLSFDGTIQKILGKIEVEKGDVVRKRKQIRYWGEELEKIDEDHKRDPLNYKSVYVNSKPKGQQSYKADIGFVNKQIVALKI